MGTTGLLVRADLGPTASTGAIGSPAPSSSVAPLTTQESPPPAGTTIVAQVVVYGSTPSGIVAAVSVARAGASVVVISPDDRLGGMMSSGLGHADAGRKDLIGGITREVFDRIGRLEADEALVGPRASSSPNPSASPAADVGQLGWDYEPHVAQRAFEQLLAEARVPVYLNEPLDRTVPVPVADGEITEIHTTHGMTVRGDVFIDASYEGDLLAAAGVPYALGRESTQTYGESLAGVHPSTVGPASRLVVGRDANGAPLPGTQVAQIVPGTADGLVQAATYRLCVTDDPANRIAFTEPAGYDPATYALFGRALATWRRRTGTDPNLGSVLTMMPLPDHKRDLNSRGLFSTDVVDGNAGWSTATDSGRAAIAASDRGWEQGLLWYLETDGHVPYGMRSAIGRWGLCADEFRSTGGWPPELYVREARRLIGETVMTQRDVQTTVTKPDAIALGTYRIDAHFVRRIVGSDDRVRGDGQLTAPTKPYEIPYRALVPPAGSVDNLLVSVAVSASHVAWASIRTEPTLMAIGQAAGAAAALAARDHVGVREVDVRAVREALVDAGATLVAPAGSVPVRLHAHLGRRSRR